MSTNGQGWTRRSIPGHLFEIADADGNPVLRIRGGTMPTLEHARLIAAAPDGLAFAESFREWFAEHFEDFTPEVNAQLLCLDNEAAAFISKATQS